MHEFEIPDWSLVKNPSHYQSRDSRHLLLTTGDSWTWGDSLGQTKVRLGLDDEQHRLEHVYGNLVSRELGHDWINLALPGISNFRILNWTSQLLNRKLPYKSIICIITLTESGRHEEQRQAKAQYNLQTNLELMLDRTYAEIQQLIQRYPQIKFLIAHNFTDARATRFKMCEQTWIEVMLDQRIQNGTHIVVSEHIEQLNYDNRYADTADVIDRALKRIDLLDSCKYCNREDSRHPTELGHEQWARYLLNQL
jgi:hypothetical protein